MSLDCYIPPLEDELAWKQYTCSFCNNRVGGRVVACSPHSHPRIFWLLCPIENCHKGSVMNNGNVFPPAQFIQNIEYLPTEVNDAFEELKIVIL